MDKVISFGKTGNLSVEQIRRDSGFDMVVKHLHSNYELYYLLSGDIHYFIENNIYHISKGTLVFVDCNQIHKTSSGESKKHERVLLCIGVDVMDEIQKAYPSVNVKQPFEGSVPILKLAGEEQNYVEKILFTMLEELKQQKMGYEELVHLKLAELLIFSVREKSMNHAEAETVASAKHQKVLEIAEYITAHYNQILSLDELSSIFYVSKYYLCRIFKEVTGFTVNEYLNINRVKKAKELLQQRKYNVTQVSEAVGYESVTHFDRVFKKYMAVSPLAYRRMHNDAK